MYEENNNSSELILTTTKLIQVIMRSPIQNPYSKKKQSNET